MKKMLINRKLRDILIILGLSLGIVLVIAGFRLGKFLLDSKRANKLADNRQPSAVIVASPVRGNLSDPLNFTSFLDAESNVTVTPLVSGIITGIFVDDGDDVTQGQLLATIDPESYDYRLNSARAAWILAEKNYERVKSVHNNSGLSQQNLEEAEVNLESAKSNYELALLQREYADIRSPLTGRIIVKYTSVGNMASVGRPLFMVGDTQKLKVVVNIPEKHWDRFSNPDSAGVMISKPSARGQGDTVKGYIDKVGTSISPVDRTFSVTVRTSEELTNWPVGAMVEVSFLFDQIENVAYLPIDVLSKDGSLWMINSEDSTAHRKEDPGIYRNSSSIAIPNEWADNTFIMEGQDYLSEGQRIRVVSRN